MRTFTEKQGDDRVWIRDWCRFDWWFPHVGIVVDERKREDEEIVVKRAWCESHRIVYFSPIESRDHGLLARVVQERRCN